MFNLFNRLTMILVLATVGLVTAAGAQNKPQVPHIAKPSITRLGNGASSGLQSDGPSPQWTLGWNVVHPADCFMFSSSGYDFLVLFTVEGPIFYTPYSDYQNVIEPACQTGNWIAFEVIDGSGDWDAVFTFDYK
jgi:hypothetical protein